MPFCCECGIILILLAVVTSYKARFLTHGRQQVERGNASTRDLKMMTSHAVSLKNARNFSLEPTACALNVPKCSPRKNETIGCNSCPLWKISR